MSGPLAISLLFIVAAIVIIIRARRSGPPVREAQCARCGYPIRGLRRYICPECGSDLLEPDAVRWPDSPPRPSIVWGLVAWSVVILVLGVAVIGIASETIPAMLPKRHHWRVFLKAPQEFGYAALAINASDTAGSEADANPRQGTITLTRSDGSVATLRIDRERMLMGQANAHGPITHESLRGWLVDSGAKGTDGQLDYQARVLHEGLVTMDINKAIGVPPHDDWTPLPNNRGKSLALIGGNSGRGSGPIIPERQIARFGMIVAFLIWIAGCVWLVRRHRMRPL